MRIDSLGIALAAAAAATMVGACSSDSLGPTPAGTSDGSAPVTTGGMDAPVAPVACGDPNQPIDPTAIIDDMEDGNSLIIRAGRRNGGWWAGGDATPGASIVPNGTASAEAIPGGRCGSRYAMRVTGQGFTDWGALISMSFSFGSVDGGPAQLQPIDASARTGITFWARIGDTSTNLVRLSISDEHSRPEAGICVVGGSPGMGCYDNFGVDLYHLGTGWTQYRVPFVGLTQRDFGVQADRLDSANLYTVEFAFGSGAIFDFWVDDISFY